jgi:hypothetical protein
MVMMMAMTPSVKASRRALFISKMLRSFSAVSHY